MSNNFLITSQFLTRELDGLLESAASFKSRETKTRPLEGKSVALVFFNPSLRTRASMVLGEGAYVYVLENLESALSRGATIYAEIKGYGSTCDAYHRVRLDDSGEEPARAMNIALENAGCTPEDVDYVNLHGTSTLLNDKIETAAVKMALGKRAYDIPMSGTKSQVGHPQGASGAAGLGATLCAISTGVVPATINLDVVDPECDLDYVPNEPRHGRS